MQQVDPDHITLWIKNTEDHIIHYQFIDDRLFKLIIATGNINNVEQLSDNMETSESWDQVVLFSTFCLDP